MDETSKSYREKVLESVTEPSVKVVPISFPTKTYKRFTKWAEVNAGNCFWLAFEKLLDKEEFITKEEFALYVQEQEQLMVALLEKINELTEKNNAPKELKTFGSRSEKKVD